MNFKILLTSAVFALGTAGLSATALADHEGTNQGDVRVDKSAVVELFRTLDQDNNGFLDREEASLNDNIRDQYRQLDENDNDELTLGEFMHVEFEEALSMK